MKKLSNNEAELKRSVAFLKKKCVTPSNDSYGLESFEMYGCYKVLFCCLQTITCTTLYTPLSVL